MARNVLKCPDCGKIIPRTAWIEPSAKIEDGIYKTIYWCKHCQKSFPVVREGELKHSWTTDGYILVKIPGAGWVREHTWVWEQTHGKLKPNTLVHHINGIKQDNRLENLIAITRIEHGGFHNNHNKSLSTQ